MFSDNRMNLSRDVKKGAKACRYLEEEHPGQRK